MLGIAQRRGLGVNSMFFLADISGTQNAESLSVSGHDSVLDSVVYHLHEMAGAIWTAVQVPLFGGPIRLLASGRTRYAAHAWGQRREEWVESFDHIAFTADHHAVTPFQSPYTTARAYVHVVDVTGCQFLRAANVVHVIRIPAVDDDVALVELG